MALIKCPECGKEISDKAAVCPSCGYPISTITSGNLANVTVTMASQRFLVTATITVSVDGKDAGILGDGQGITLQVPKGEHTIILKGSTRKREIKIDVDGDKRVDVKWNRLTGSIDASVFEV